MDIHFLGTNGWFCSDQGETPCVLIDAAEAYVVFDAGNALAKIDRYITTADKPIVLFLSHFHLDHTFGLHTLPKFRFAQGLTLIGQPGTDAVLTQFCNRPLTAPLDKLPTRVTLREVAPGAYDAPVPFRCDWLVHADPCLGFRVTLEGKAIAYCTDTGACPAVVELARNADLLITECAWRVQNQQPSWPHLAPEDGAQMARDANVAQLALMHFDAHQYRSRDARLDAQTRAQAIFPNARAMFDNDTITL